MHNIILVVDNPQFKTLGIVFFLCDKFYLLLCKTFRQCLSFAEILTEYLEQSSFT